MSHCAPQATLKPKRFQFTPKTAISNIFVAQVYWEAVPNVAQQQQSFCRQMCYLCVDVGERVISIGLSRVLKKRPTRHSIGHFEAVFTANHLTVTDKQTIRKILNTNHKIHS